MDGSNYNCSAAFRKGRHGESCATAKDRLPYARPAALPCGCGRRLRSE